MEHLEGRYNIRSVATEARESITITLTSELEKAVSERAQRQGIAPEHLALMELNRLFLTSSPMAQDNDLQTWETRVKRYQSLVEKDFVVGLTAEEAQQCDRLGVEIDAAETDAKTAVGEDPLLAVLRDIEESSRTMNPKPDDRDNLREFRSGAQCQQ